MTVNQGFVMDEPEDHPHRRLADLERRVRALAESGRWDDREIQDALLSVARSHLWRQGLWMRIKFAVNIVGFLGVIGGAVIALLGILGIEVVRQ